MVKSGDTSQVIFWGLVLLVAIVILAVAIWLLRKKLFGAANNETSEMWSLQHLRQMHADGQITDSEFETLKSKYLSGLRGASPGNSGANPQGSRDIRDA